MIAFPNAKINLGLHVLAKREDGFHNIETCLYPIELCDVLEIIKSNRFNFNLSGLKVEGASNSNLVVKAYNLLKTDFDLTPVSIHLHKLIPTGAGLGGGSSDGAFALRLLNEIFRLGLTSDQLKKYAATLGSDCPFFIDNTPMLATGTGTKLQTIDLNLNDYRIKVVHSNVHVSTATAYSLVKPRKPDQAISELLQLPIDGWQDILKNDFEEPMLADHPEILRIKNELLADGAIYVSMTGSGSSVYAIANK